MNLKSLKNVFHFILHHPLGRRQKWESFKRFIFFQCSQIPFRRPVIRSFTSKTKLIVEKGMTGATGNVYCGLHEFEDMAFLLHFLRPNDLFIDVGANVGSYTLLASGHIGSNSISIEPIPETYNHLINNLVLNGIENRVEAINAGVGECTGVLEFTSKLDTVNHVALEGEFSETIKVKVVSLDDQLRNQYPILMKIDVEGYEMHLLRGAKLVLGKSQLKAIIIELNDSGEKYGTLKNEEDLFLRSNGFLPFLYDPFSRSLSPLQKKNNSNVLYLRDIQFIKDRVEKSEPVEILKIRF